MKILGSSWQNKEGFQYHIQIWEPDKKPKALVCLVHGLGEHSARYTPVGEVLARAGYALVGFDLRGHGRSSGQRGHTPSYAALMNDIADFLEQARQRYRGVPIFLYGHSLGGNLVLNFALRRKPRIQGVMATSPWLRLVTPPPVWQVSLARIVNRIAPWVTVKWGLDTKALSHDAKVVEHYDHDPLVHGRISVRMFVDAFDAGSWALDHAAEFPLPLLLMHGTADQATSPAASREFARRARKVTTWRAWDGWYHELHNEPGKARVVRFMKTWMDRKLKRK